MVKFLADKILFHSTERVCPDEAWPLPQRLCKIELNCYGKDVATCLPALEKLEGRSDVNCLCLDFEHLLDGNIRQVLDDLFQKRDRAWKIEVIFQFPIPEHVEISCLRSALSILRFATYLDVTSSGRSDQQDRQLDVLGNLPHFENLKCLNLEYWGFDQNDVVAVVYNSSFPCTNFPVHSHNLPLRGPMFPSHTARYIHSICLDLVNVPSETASQLSRMVISLPALKNLTVGMPLSIITEDYEEALSMLFSWLENSQCPIASLTFDYLRREHLPLIIATIPKMPLLTCLRVMAFQVFDSHLDEILLAIASSPVVNCICFEYCFQNCEEAYQRLLQFQLECRPRRMSIDVEDKHHVVTSISRTYQAVEDFERTTEKGPFPIYAWPFYLGLLSDSLNEKSRTVREVVLESTYNGLQHLLPSYTCGWEVKLAFVVQLPVETSNNVSEFGRARKKSRKNGI